MIKLNELMEVAGCPGSDMTIILGKGQIIFKGITCIGRNSKILIWGGGTLTFGNDCMIPCSGNISCCNQITIGEGARIGYETTISDTNYHFTYDLGKLIITNNNNPVEIGDHCWVGARSSIMKGVKLPSFTTIASNSLVNKNITNEESCLIGGSPAKLIRTGFRRVFNKEKEIEIAQFFANNPFETIYEVKEPISQYN